MELEDLLPIFFERSSANQMFWNFYLAVALALMALFGSLKPSPKVRPLAAILTLGFLVFSAVNLHALNFVREQRQAMKSLIMTAKYERTDDRAAADSISTALDVPSASGLLLLHIAGDFLVVGSIWVLALRTKE